MKAFARAFRNHTTSFIFPKVQFVCLCQTADERECHATARGSVGRGVDVERVDSKFGWHSLPAKSSSYLSCVWAQLSKLICIVRQVAWYPQAATPPNHIYHIPYTTYYQFYIVHICMLNLISNFNFRNIPISVFLCHFTLNYKNNYKSSKSLTHFTWQRILACSRQNKK